MALNPEYSRELNVLDVSPERLAELREQYEDDSVAQWQIDRFDPDSELRQRLRTINDAFFEGCLEDIKSLSEKYKAWREQKYPGVEFKEYFQF